MSRSYKRYPSFSDGGDTHFSKREANKKVRKNWGISNGGSYKKAYEQWNIRDYKSVFYWSTIKAWVLRSRISYFGKVHHGYYAHNVNSYWTRERFESGRRK